MPDSLQRSLVGPLPSWIRNLDWVVIGDLAGLVGISLVTVAFSSWLLYRQLPKAFPKAHRWGERLGGVRIQRLTLLTPQRVGDLVVGLLRTARLFALLWVLLVFLPLVSSLFSTTHDGAMALLGRVMRPLRLLGQGVVQNIDNVVFIAVVVIVVHFTLRVLRKLFGAIGRQEVVFRNFDAELATITYQLARFAILALAAVVIFPYIPGSQTDAFKGIGIFVGILMTLGSTSAMGNLVAGALLVYMRPFSIGHRVKIADTVGDVVDRDLLVTRIRTIKNVEITLPNATILGSHIVNYSASSQDLGLIIHTSVTIGYDVPWRKVHEILIAAAHATSGIVKEPAPFVLQTDLGDYSIRYEINGYTHEPAVMARTASALHENVQDQFAAAGVEILSPQYTALRDGQPSTIPSDTSA